MADEGTRQETTRQELYDLVWSEPIKNVAPLFGVSDVGLAKACRRAEVPVPDRGYWAKKRAGKPTFQVRLPPRPLGLPEEVYFGDRAWNRHYRGGYDEEELLGPLPPRPAFAEPIESVRERVRKRVGKVRLSAIPGEAHLAIAKLLDEDEKRRERQRSSPYPSTWDAPKFDEPIAGRRLRILSSLFTALSRAGCIAGFRDGDAKEPVVRVGDQSVSFTVETTGQRSRAAATRRKPAERLRLEIPGAWDGKVAPRRWEDDEHRRLEGSLAEIVMELIVTGEVYYRLGRERMYEWRVERKTELEKRRRKEAEERARKERERQLKLERERRNGLLNEVNAWQQAAAIRRYVEAVRGAAGGAALPIESERWAAWALEEAEQIDPLRRRAAGAGRSPPE